MYHYSGALGRPYTNHSVQIKDKWQLSDPPSDVQSDLYLTDSSEDLMANFTSDSKEFGLSLMDEVLKRFKDIALSTDGAPLASLPPASSQDTCPVSSGCNLAPEVILPPGKEDASSTSLDGHDVLPHVPIIATTDVRVTAIDSHKSTNSSFDSSSTPLQSPSLSQLPQQLATIESCTRFTYDASDDHVKQQVASLGVDSMADFELA
ncbi:unnamed protein product [Protopolystoma xenopodis]|uniref:Uncharacterized protein n=1 Tax=Protopolystoma xenopodis TaxID=117903 RepID=A0A448WIM5_9PLAT|nr:unnamed protein product [Protopolystoma xenopodis]